MDAFSVATTSAALEFLFWGLKWAVIMFIAVLAICAICYLLAGLFGKKKEED